MKALSAAALAATVGSAAAWWDVGHQTVGAIARMKMTNEKSAQNLDNILTYLDALYNDEHGEWPYGDFNVDASQRPEQKSSNLAWAAVWPDTVKGFYNVKMFDNWHYINGKYDPEGLDTEDTGCNTKTDTNIVYVLTNLVRQIPDTYKGRPTAHWYLHFGMTFLAHNVGDVHQPYHTVGRCIIYDGKLDQDLGGNRWLLTTPDGVNTNAHAIWDSVAFAWGNDKQAEIEAEDNTYDTFAKALLEKVTVEQLAEAGYDTNFTADGDYKNFADRLEIWAKESNDIAIESYNRTTLNGTVDQEFMDWVVSTSELRVVAAGYRMAALLDGMLAEMDVPAYEPKAATSEAVAVEAATPAAEANAETSSDSGSGIAIWVPIVAAVAGLVVGVAVTFFITRSKKSRGHESSTHLDGKA